MLRNIKEADRDKWSDFKADIPPEYTPRDRLCGLVVGVAGYRPRGSAFDFCSLDFLSSTGSGTGSTQPREDEWEATWTKQ
jgi:hypothetical protein